MDKHVYFLLFSYEHAIHSTVLLANEDGGWKCPFEDSITAGGEKGVAAFWARTEWAICRTNRRLKLLLDLMGMKRV